MPSLHTAAERPDLWERGIDSEDVWPEYNLHGDVLNRWWGQLDEELAQSAWLMGGVDLDVVFDTEASQMWEVAIRRLGADPSALQTSHGVH